MNTTPERCRAGLPIGLLAALVIGAWASPGSTLAAAEPTVVAPGPPPSVHLEGYTGKPTQSFAFAGEGFVPGEQVDIYLGSQATQPLVTVSADSQGKIAARDVPIPMIDAGDYSLSFVGQASRSPFSVGFNVQGFRPWVVLDAYYLLPHSGVGFSGQDFVPGEPVQVYLNTRDSQPVAQYTADATGRLSAKSAFELPDLTGINRLVFVGQQSQAEIVATFAVAEPALDPTPTPR